MTRSCAVCLVRREGEMLWSSLLVVGQEELARMEAEHAERLERDRQRSEEALAARRERMRKEQEEARDVKMKEAAQLDAATRDRVLQEFEADKVSGVLLVVVVAAAAAAVYRPHPTVWKQMMETAVPSFTVIFLALDPLAATTCIVAVLLVCMV